MRKLSDITKTQRRILGANPADWPYAGGEFEAAEVTGLSVQKLRRYRLQGGGPPFYKAGARCVYVLQEAVDWLKAQKRGGDLPGVR